MKSHFIYVEEDGSVSWSGNPKRLNRGEGTIYDGSVIGLGHSTWKIENGRSTTTLKLRNKHGNVVVKQLRPGGLYKILPNVVTTLMLGAVRGHGGFEPVMRMRPADEAAAGAAPATA